MQFISIFHCSFIIIIFHCIYCSFIIKLSLSLITLHYITLYYIAMRQIDFLNKKKGQKDSKLDTRIHALINKVMFNTHAFVCPTEERGRKKQKRKKNGKMRFVSSFLGPWPLALAPLPTPAMRGEGNRKNSMECELNEIKA